MLHSFSNRSAALASVLLPLGKIRSNPLPYFFAEGKRENGTLCCGFPSGTYTNRGYVVLPLLQMGGRNATSTR